MSDAKDDRNDDRLQKADMRMLDSLLRQALRPEPAARDARIERVLHGLDEQTAAPIEDARLSAAEGRHGRKQLRRWASIALAASLLLSVSLWWHASSGPQRAYAVVQQCLTQAAEMGARHYRVTVVVHRPLVGRMETVSDLYVDGAERFALRHPPLLLPGEVWIGGNEREKWIVPPIGPILVGNENMLQKWMADKANLSTPYLHVTTILHRMSKGYDLEVLPDDTLGVPGRPGATTGCRRVRGILRHETRGLPRTIDLWVDVDTGIARRLVLDWQLPPAQFGRSKVTMELVDRPELSPDWFEHSPHHEERRPVLGMGL